jgi:hypothetical protein
MNVSKLDGFNKFLSFVCGDDRTWNLTAVRADAPFLSGDFKPCVTRSADAFSWCQTKADAGYGIYFGINPQTAQRHFLKTKGVLSGVRSPKANKDDITEARFLWVDIDPLATLTGAALDDWRAETLAKARTGGAMKKPPTIILDSGRGYWMYWKLAEPVSLDGHLGATTLRVESFAEGIRKLFNGADACQNVDRITRLPGFVNKRTGRLAAVIEFHSDRSFALTDFPQDIRPPREKGADIKVLDNPINIEQFKKFLEPQHWLRKGAEGYVPTVNTLQRAMDFGLSPGTTAEILMGLFSELGGSQRTSPRQEPWSEDGLIDYSERLEDSRKDPVGFESVANFFEEVVPPGGLEASDVESDKPLKFDFIHRRDMKRTLNSEWLIKKVLPLSGVGTIYAPSGEYKSFATIDVGYHVATGQPWGGRKTRQACVAYIAAEGGGGFWKRQWAWEKEHDKIPFEDAPFYTVLASPNLGTGDEDARELTRCIRILKIPSPGLIVIDTLAQSLGGGDENGSGMQMMIQNCNKLANLYHCFVLLVHHTPLSNPERMRGSGQLFNAVDASFLIQKQENETNRATLNVVKMKDEDGGQSFDIKLKKVVLGIDEDGDEVSSLAAISSTDLSERTVAEKAADKMSLGDRRVATVKIMQDKAEISIRQLTKQSQMSRPAVIETLESLRKDRYVSKDTSVARGAKGLYVLTQKGKRADVGETSILYETIE